MAGSDPKVLIVLAVCVAGCAGRGPEVTGDWLRHAASLTAGEHLDLVYRAPTFAAQDYDTLVVTQPRLSPVFETSGTNAWIAAQLGRALTERLQSAQVFSRVVYQPIALMTNERTAILETTLRPLDRRNYMQPARRKQIAADHLYVQVDGRLLQGTTRTELLEFTHLCHGPTEAALRDDLGRMVQALVVTLAP